MITFAIVGLGRIGKRHAAIIQGNPDCNLVAVCDIDSAQTEYAQTELNVPFYPDFTQLLANTQGVDVICICTPNGLHAQQARIALAHKHHVVIEKPMALSKEECEAVIFHALQHSRYVFCVMQNRYSPPSVWLKSLLEENRLGKIRMVQANCYWNRDERYYDQNPWRGTLALDGGPLFTQFSHFVDLLYWLFGDITHIKANFANFAHQQNTEFEDTGSISFQFVKGGLGVFNYSTAVWKQNFESSITLIGERGTVKVGGQYMESLVHCDILDYDAPTLPPSNPPNNYGRYKGSAANHHYIFENVVQTLNGKSTITTNALEGLKVVDIIERIYQLRPEFRPSPLS